MAEVKIDDLIAEYAQEIGRLSSELIKQKAIFTAEIVELTEKLNEAEQELQNLKK